MADLDLPTVDDIYAVHDAVVEQWNLTHTGTRTVLPDQTLESILDDARECDDPYVSAATLLRTLATSHVFEDGNKRTAWVVAKSSLVESGRTVAPSGQRIATVMKHIKRFDVLELARWLETGEIDESRFRTSPDE
jgi:death-on-curing protein